MIIMDYKRTFDLQTFSIMSHFHLILAHFTRLGYHKQHPFTQPQLDALLDRISTANAVLPTFDRDIAQQLWEHTNKTADGKVELKDYIQTIIDARHILHENIQKCQRHLALPHTPNKPELQDCILSYTEDIEVISKTFKIEGQMDGKMEGGLPEKSVATGSAAAAQLDMNSKIFSDEISPREESLSLRYGLYLVLVLVGCELLSMSVRHHFVNLMAYLAVLAIYFLKYFDAAYMRTVLLTLSIAIIADLLWLFLHAPHYWNLPQQTQYSHLRGRILAFVVIVAAATALGKALLFILLFRFRSNLPSTRKVVHFCGNTVELNGEVKKNPVSGLLRNPESQYSG